MRKILFAVAVAAIPGTTLAQTNNANQDMERWLTMPTSKGMANLQPSCLQMPALKLCPGNPPTVWMDPKAEPRDVARHLLEALVQMGFREQ